MFIKLKEHKKDKYTAINIEYIEYIRTDDNWYTLKMAGNYVFSIPKTEESKKTINDMLLTRSCKVIQ